MLYLLQMGPLGAHDSAFSNSELWAALTPGAVLPAASFPVIL